MPKTKSHKGLLKRIRLTKSGKVKFTRAYGRHLRSHKKSTLLQQYRKPKYAGSTDAGRLSRMLHVPVTPARPKKDREQESNDATA